jgi:hypothetical protein
MSAPVDLMLPSSAFADMTITQRARVHASHAAELG